MACSPLLMAQSGMTDQQVLEYAKDGVKQGKDQRTIATELARRGVTREQAERVKKLYEQQTNTDSNNLTGTAKAEARLLTCHGTLCCIAGENSRRFGCGI